MKTYNYYPPIHIDVANKIKCAVEAIINEKNEKAFAYSCDGEELAYKIGSLRSVHYDNKVLKYISNTGKTCRVISGHSHPDNCQLSGADMRMALGHNINDTFAVDPNRDCQIMTLPKLNFLQKNLLRIESTFQEVGTNYFLIPSAFIEIISGKKIFDKAAMYCTKGMEKIFKSYGAKFHLVKLDELPNILSKG